MSASWHATETTVVSRLCNEATKSLLILLDESIGALAPIPNSLHSDGSSAAENKEIVEKMKSIHKTHMPALFAAIGEIKAVELAAKAVCAEKFEAPDGKFSEDLKGRVSRSFKPADAKKAPELATYVDRMSSIMSAAVGGADEDLVLETPHTVRVKCPVTLALMKEPVFNTACKHVYSRAGIMSVIAAAKKKVPVKPATCPMPGCNKPVSEATLKEDMQTQIAVEKEEKRLAAAAAGAGDDGEEEDAL